MRKTFNFSKKPTTKYGRETKNVRDLPNISVNTATMLKMITTPLLENV
jgi:hypothetical protein